MREVQPGAAPATAGGGGPTLEFTVFECLPFHVHSIEPTPDIFYFSLTRFLSMIRMTAGVVTAAIAAVVRGERLSNSSKYLNTTR